MTPQGEPATVIVATSSDLASTTLAKALIANHGFRSTGISFAGKPVYQNGSLLLALFEGPIVRPPDLDLYFNPRAYIFLSRHSAESGIPSLTAHTTGNFSEAAEAGGAGRELSRADPGLLKDYLVALWKRKDRVGSYQVTVEATHHGPTSLSKPVLFVELGSSEVHWGDEGAATVVTDALMECLLERKVWERTALAFGGTHYPKKFNDIIVEGDYAVSFIVPKHSLGDLDEKMIAQMLQKSTSPVRYAIVDWKGLGPHKDKILHLVSQFGLEVVRV